MASTPSATVPGTRSSNEALTPVPSAERAFDWRHHASLWFSLGVGLLVMQVGAYLVPALGPQQALLAIVGGSVIGAGLLAWVAKIGCDSGLASAGLMQAVYGTGFARLPIVLNIVQLLGWGAFELVVMRDATIAVGRQAGVMAAPAWAVAATVLWGALLALLVAGSMVRLVRRLVSRLALPLVILSLLWLTWQFAAMALAQGWSTIWSRPGAGGMGLLPALDLVIAMPVSWLPLVADYARHGRDGRAALRGTWLGYAVANTWCYALGVLVAITLPSQDLVTALLLAQGGVIALSLILVDEVDNAYGDCYSGAVSSHSLMPRWTVRRWGLAMVAACTVLALALPMHSLEPFLLMLSSIFVPLFGVIIGRLAGADTVARLARAKRAEAAPIAIWIAGIAAYHLCRLYAPSWGAALPSLALTFTLALATRPADGAAPSGRRRAGAGA
ncbi:purine-cytosine permease family protein [Ramlibacter sp.]|uniref:purine-cytosine permease family protein n=1 Tax=Ramlibacter sp. TaxID=1917967 RepID=UPI002BAF840D|nr:cytosine permease [Ramlibacter sp.]HWI83661.1 cytosine permease [Ramlibacter sp.]